MIEISRMTKGGLMPSSPSRKDPKERKGPFRESCTVCLERVPSCSTGEKRLSIRVRRECLMEAETCSKAFFSEKEGPEEAVGAEEGCFWRRVCRSSMRFIISEAILARSSLGETQASLKKNRKAIRKIRARKTKALLSRGFIRADCFSHARNFSFI